MRKIIVIFFLFLLFSCNERESKESNEKSGYKDKYNVVDTSKFKSENIETDPYGVLEMTYAVIVSKQSMCDLVEESVKDNEQMKELMIPMLNECKFYREVYKKVIPNFESVNLVNADKYYYFKYSEENSEDSISNIVGIFSDVDNCNKFKEDFLNKEIGLTSNCKKISFVN